MPYGLAHEVALGMPIIKQLLSPLGAVRASHAAAERLLAADKKVLVYPGGDLDAMRPHRHRNRVVFGGRAGFMRLALKSGAPIVPIVAAGAHSTLYVIDDLRWLAKLIGADKHLRIKVWPLTLSFPWGLTLGPMPPWIPFPAKIRIEVLDPIVFEGAHPRDADDPELVASRAEHVRQTMETALQRLASVDPATAGGAADH